MTPEVSIGATGEPSNTGAAPATSTTAVDTPTTQDTDAAPSGQLAGDAITAPVQGEPPTTETDPLDGVPSLDELNALPDTAQYKKSLIQLRSAIEQQFKPQLSELTERLKPFEPVADRFQKPEELQQLVQLNDQLFGSYERDPETQALVPNTSDAAKFIHERDRLTADYLTADMLNLQTIDPATNQPISRMDLLLKSIAEIPERRAEALQLLGGVEPDSVAPTWAPTTEELAEIKPEYHDLWRKLPWEEREELKALSPEALNRQLGKEKFQADLMAETEKLTKAREHEQQQRQAYQQQQAQQAGNSHVEQGFRQGMTEFTQSVVGKAQFIAPLDAQSPEAQNLPPEQVQQFNAKAQQVNTGLGRFIAMTTAALAHPDTQWMAAEFLQALGVEQKVLTSFDQARQEYANNARMYGELSYGQNGNGQPAGLGTVQSNATQAMTRMKGYGSQISGTLFKLVSDLFELKAGSYNATLNGAVSARPPVNGTPFDPTTAPLQRPTGWQSRAEIQRQFG